MHTADVLILGAGIAGASAAAHLASHAKVILIEAEEHPGRHATGRSAAMYFETYGNDAVRSLVRAGRDFLLSPPEGFADTPLMTPRAALFIATEAQLPQLQAMRDDPLMAAVTAPLALQEALAQVPILRQDRLAGALIDHSGFEMDVDALFQGFLRLARSAGARLITDAGFDGPIHYEGGRWTVGTRQGVFVAPLLVNATGAWADEVAVRAGVRPIGLRPLRRTALVIPSPRGMETRSWPMVIDADEQFYFKPEAGNLLLSPANEDSSPPCDAAPDELDIAIAVDRFETATTQSVDRILHRWAGLRSFVVDRTPVVGFAPDAPGFFWLAGQGGYGIETSPAMGLLAASLVSGNGTPAGLTAHGIDASSLSPTRCHASGG